MSVRLAALAFVLLVTAAAPGRADDRCAVPLADWQPREALAMRLDQLGWTAQKIRVDDGCYKVIAVDRDGKTVKGRFDPATLERIERGDHDGHGHRDRREGHDD